MFRRISRRRKAHSPVLAAESLESRLVLSATSVVAQTMDVTAQDQVFALAGDAATVQQQAVPAEVQALLSTGQRTALQASHKAVADAQADLKQKQVHLVSAKVIAGQTKTSLKLAKSAHATAKSAFDSAKSAAEGKKTRLGRLQKNLQKAERTKARFEKDADNLLKSGLISRWIRKYGENSHEVAQARSALQQQLDGAAKAAAKIKQLHGKVQTAKAQKQKANARVQTAKTNLQNKKTAVSKAATAHRQATKNVKTAVDAVKLAQTALDNAKTAEQRAIRRAFTQANNRAQRHVKRHATIMKSFSSASNTFKQKLDQVNSRRAHVAGLANWFGAMSEVTGFLDELTGENADPTHSLKLGSDLLRAAGDFLFPGLGQLSRNAQGEYEADEAGHIQLVEAIEAGNRLNKYAGQLDGAQKNLEKVHAALPFLQQK